MGNLANRDSLRDQIVSFFQELADTHVFLTHLHDIQVTILDWCDFEVRLETNPDLAFRWFPGLLSGFSLLEDYRPTGKFRFYLASDKLPYYGRAQYTLQVQLETEEDLVQVLEKGPDTGLIVRRPGGAGKTRLTLELGKVAAAHGWLVVRAKGELRAAELDRLAATCGTQRILLLIDYVETQREFSNFVERLNDLNQEAGLHMAYVANCRNSYYPTLEAIPNHRPVAVDERGRTGSASYAEETVRHILRTGGLECTLGQLEVCHGVPVLAVFLSYLHSQGRAEELGSLIAERDFAEWVAKRLQLSFPDRPVAELALELAVIFALFPMAEESYLKLRQSRFRDLVGRLEADEWIERVEEPAGETRWVTLHDVVADRMVLRYLETHLSGAESYARELCRTAVDLDNLRSAVVTLQRLAGREEVGRVRWKQLFEDEIGRQPESWRTVRDMLLATPLLAEEDSIGLLAMPGAFWEGIERTVEAQGRLGWLARWILTRAPKETADELRATIEPWLIGAARSVCTSNFALTRALEMFPQRVHTEALEWIRCKPKLFQTHYLPVAWLNQGLDAQQIQLQVRAWAGVQANALSFNASHLYRAWLDASKDHASVRTPLLNWIGQHGQKLEAQFVYRAWLDATGDTGSVRDALATWLVVHADNDEIDFVCRSWLEAGGDFDFVREPTLVWVEKHNQEERAVFLLKYVTKQRQLPRSAILGVLGWCRRFATHEDAIWRLTRLGPQLWQSELIGEFVETAETVLSYQLRGRVRQRDGVLGLLALLAGARMHMSLETLEQTTEQTTVMLVKALRHPDLFRAVGPIPAAVQQQDLFRWFVELIQTQSLTDPIEQRHIGQFLDWVNGWGATQKKKIAVTYGEVVAKFPDQKALWSRLDCGPETPR